MTTYTFVPASSTTVVNWNDASLWSGGVVPNGPDADVVVPETTVVSTGQAYVSFITMSETYELHSLSITANYLVLNGALTVDGTVSLSTDAEIDLDPGASLTMASCMNDGNDIQGSGQITCSGAFENQTEIVGNNLTLTAAALDNTGKLVAASGSLTVDVTPGGFTNLSGTTLTGGSYAAAGPSDVLDMNVGGVVTVDAANLSLNGEIAFWDSGKSAYVPIESTLQTVAASGTLTLSGADSWGAVTDDGHVQISGGAPTFTQLTIDPGGMAGGTGSISGPIVDNGTILAGQDGVGGALTVTGPVSGSGTLQIATAGASILAYGATQHTGASLELGSTCSATVAFKDGYGALTLDDPSGFTGTIAPAGGGDRIVLKGIADSSVTGWSYSGTKTGGTLEIDLSDGSHLDLNFSGDFSANSFTMAAGPQTLSSDPPSLEITNLDSAIPAQDLLRDHFSGAGVSDILISNTDGTVVVGQVSGGQESYTTVAGLGPEWSFHGAGDFLGDGKSGFLIENTDGYVFDGEVSGGVASYTEVAALGPEWSFVGTGDFFGAGQGVVPANGGAPVGGGQDQFLIENASGQLELGTVLNGQATYIQLQQLSSDWKVLGAGAFLADGRTQYLVENSSGLIEVGDVQNEKPVYTEVAALGREWKYVGSGDMLADGKDQFLIENSSGTLVAGDIGSDGKAHYTSLVGLGPEWTVEGLGDYLGEGHDQVVIKNTNGSVVIGDWSGGQIHWTQVGLLGPEWSFHG